nr:ATP synthase F0 subunit 8 [Jacobiasca formosana]UER93870.1 ATP synthase F0 subunit 8 [Jacobiasca formosana]
MPQMAPLWWLTLMILFLMNYLISLSIIYYKKNYKINLNYNFIYKNMNWLW